MEKAVGLIADTRKISVAAKANGLTWTQAYEERQREARIAASLKRAEARVAAHATHGTTPDPHTATRTN